MQQFIEQIYRNNKNYEGIIFLDRDGTINGEVNYLRSKKQLEILPTVIRGIRLLNKRRIVPVVITNQPVVARGLITIEDLKKVNGEMFKKLEKEGAFIGAIYSCPHHPQKNHHDIPPNAAKYRISCECRKPGIVMYKKALSVFGSKKVFGVIGDQTRDVLAGQKLKIPTAIVLTGYKGKDGKYDVSPDFVCDNFLTAVRCIIRLK